MAGGSTTDPGVLATYDPSGQAYASSWGAYRAGEIGNPAYQPTGVSVPTAQPASGMSWGSMAGLGGMALGGVQSSLNRRKAEDAQILKSNPPRLLPPGPAVGNRMAGAFRQGLNPFDVEGFNRYLQMVQSGTLQSNPRSLINRGRMSQSGGAA
jgi:hypothetical protein